MKALVVCNPCPKNLRNMVDYEDYGYIVAVDGTANDLINQEVRINLAIGDFDSIELNTLQGIKSYASDVIQLKPEKDITDTYAAIEYLVTRHVKDITIIGGIKGNRPEHLLANINILKQYPELRLRDETTSMFTLKPGKYRMDHNNCYYNFFAAEEVIDLTLEGFKYNLEDYKLTTFDSRCISNERDDIYSTVKFSRGLLLVVVSKFDNKEE